MPDITPNSAQSGPRATREVADAYVVELAALDPILATQLGLRAGEDRLPDFSPAGQEAVDALARATLAKLDAVESSARLAGGAGLNGGNLGGGTLADGNPGGADLGGDHLSGADLAGDDLAGADLASADLARGDERRCARLLRERLNAMLALTDQGEHLRTISNIFGPVQRVRNVFLDMPTGTEDDWAVIARRMAWVTPSLAGYHAALHEGASRGLLAAPRQARAVAAQLAEWTAVADGQGWFAEFAAGADVSPALRADLDQAAASAISAVAELGQWLAGDYLSRAQGVPDGVGAERYRVLARRWTGADLEPEDVYAWGWSEFQSLRAEMAQEAELVLPGASALAAMRHLDSCGEAVEGVEEIRLRLQQMMDDAIRDLDGTHFDIAERLKVVQARIAPHGSAAAPYYTAPSQDFTRPGRTWLPTLGRTRFPLWNLVSVWYHEGVPGHHLQLAQWRHLSERLSMYQTAVGGVSACSEGWALYAERLMDELGYLSSPGARLGYLEAQLMRAIRVVIDIGMHLELQVPDDSPLGAGQRWTPELAREFFGAHSGRDADFLDSEIVRYLSTPGQAISYKLGERAWLTGRDAARATHGRDFDLKSWHMAALSLGSLGLDDLTDELASL